MPKVKRGLHLDANEVVSSFCEIFISLGILCYAIYYLANLTKVPLLLRFDISFNKIPFFIKYKSNAKKEKALV